VVSEQPRQTAKAKTKGKGNPPIGRRAAGEKGKTTYKRHKKPPALSSRGFFYPFIGLTTFDGLKQVGVGASAGEINCCVFEGSINQ
jgi:hypothetical protein